MGYKKDAIKGFSYLGAFRIVTRIVSFIRTAVIARILSPSQVGVFGIATIVLSFMEILTETGINIFLIQKKEEIDKYISTAWVTSIARGWIIALIIFLWAPFISQFFQIQESLSILQLIAVVPFIRGFINPSIAKFIKDLSFHKEFYYQTSIFFVESLFSIILIFIYPTPLSLVWGLITGAIFEVILSFFLASPRPALLFEFEKLKEVLARGKWLTLTGIFNYLYHNGDDVVVGKLLGTSALGLYGMAYKISMLPISEGSDVIGRVTFPVFTKISDDLPRLKKAYIKSLILIAGLVIPMGSIFYFFPREIIAIILGEKWLDAAEVLQVLALFGVIRALSISVISPLYALEKQEYITIITLISFTGMAATIIPFVSLWGIVGAGYAALSGTIISLPVIGYFFRKAFYSQQ